MGNYCVIPQSLRVEEYPLPHGRGSLLFETEGLQYFFLSIFIDLYGVFLWVNKKAGAGEGGGRFGWG